MISRQIGIASLIILAFSGAAFAWPLGKNKCCDPCDPCCGSGPEFIKKVARRAPLKPVATQETVSVAKEETISKKVEETEIVIPQDVATAPVEAPAVKSTNYYPGLW